MITQSIFDTWKCSREIYVQLFNDFSLEQLNNIPIGFKNNIIWNVGHIIVAQQALVYKQSGQLMHIPMELLAKYAPGTKPEEDVSQEEADQLKDLLISVIEQTQTDYKAGLFATYQERQTATGFPIKSVEDALNFNNYHEGLHFGIIMQLKKFL